MSLKNRVLILKRIRAGDQDLIAKAYGQGGIVDILVRDAYLNTHRFFGVFEPFNLVEVDLSQKGGIAIPNDILGVRRFSLLSRDYNRFLWMSWISGFILKQVSFYDDRLFDLFLRYMLEETEGKEHIYRIRLKLDYLILSGLKPRFLSESFGRGRLRIKLSNGSVHESGDYETKSYVLRLLVKVWRAKKIKNLKINKDVAHEMEQLVDTFINYHTK